MMKDMRRDETLERTFREYFEGNEAPACDLTRAKQALRAPARAKKPRMLWRVLSVCACVLLVCAVSLAALFGGILDAPVLDEPPAEDSAQGNAPAQRYALASAQAQQATYAQLAAEYDVGGLAPFEWADNAQARYTLYRLDGRDVLLRVQLKYLQGLSFWEAEVSIDLTGGTLLPEELQRFEAMRPVQGYHIATQLVNGEYVSDAVLVRAASDCYLTVTGQESDAVYVLLRLLGA